jgi:hypothetical protein
MIKKYSFFLEKYTHKSLNDKFWTNYQLDSGVRKKLIKIAKDFYKSLGIDLEIQGIKLTGSLANFNYTENSDLDVHIMVDFSQYDGDDKVLEDMMKSKAFIWNLKHDINIRGADVELYIQDINEKHTSTGLFSLTDNKWIKKPEYTDPEVDEDDVRVKYNRWVYDITKLKEGLNENLSDEEYSDYSNRVEKLKIKLRNLRKKGLQEEGEFSTENVVFKKLRNNGFIDTLYDIGYKYYDRMFSQ